MKYLKLFEAFEDNDYELIFSYLKDRTDIKVQITGDMSDFTVTIINIEPTTENYCPDCDDGKIVDVFYGKDGERYKDDVDCKVCSGRGELEYFEWDIIKDTIHNFYNYFEKDYYVETYSIYNYRTDLPLSEFLEEIESNSRLQKITDFSIIIGDDPWYKGSM